MNLLDDEVLINKGRWFVVKDELRPLIKKKDCTELEQLKKSEIRKTIKEKCVEFMKDATKFECIGAGTFGEVWTMKLNENSPLLVQKICRRVENVRAQRMETCCLSYVNSEYIPKLVYSGYTEDGKWCTVMEYFSGGTLEYHIYEEIRRQRRFQEPNINDQQKKFIAYHLALAIEYLQKEEFTHGDLKPNNVVLSQNGGVRLIDFGHATDLQKKKLKVLPKQTAYFSSPEVWKQEPAGLPSDWFSYGVNIVYLYQLKVPFDGRSEEEIQKHVLDGKPDVEDVKDEAAKDLIKKLLVVDPELRPKKVSDDAFFADVNAIVPFQPVNIKCNVHKPSKAAVFETNDTAIYEFLEAATIRIPTAEYLDYVKSLQ